MLEQTFNDTTISGGGNALLIQSTAGDCGTVTNLGTWEKTGNSSGNDTISVAVQYHERDGGLCRPAH